MVQAKGVQRSLGQRSRQRSTAFHKYADDQKRHKWQK